MADLTTWYRSRMAKITDGVEEAMEDAGIEGEELMRHLIETRGTGRQWSRPWGPNGRTASTPGRDDTGKMKRAVGSRTLRKGGSAQVRFGWVSGTREDYFRYQESGFHNELVGIDVPGMYALQDARDETLNKLKDRLARLAKRG